MQSFKFSWFHGFVLNASVMCFLSLYSTIKVLVHLFLTIRIIIWILVALRKSKTTSKSQFIMQPSQWFIIQINKNSENMTNCTYRFMILMTYKKLKLKQTLSLSLFFYTCSLNKNFDDLEYLIKTKNQIFNVITIIEHKIKSKKSI